MHYRIVLTLIVIICIAWRELLLPSIILGPLLLALLLFAAFSFSKLARLLKIDTDQPNLRMISIILFLCTAMLFTIGGEQSASIMLGISFLLIALVLYAMFAGSRDTAGKVAGDRFFYYFTFCTNFAFVLFNHWHPFV